MIIVDLNYFFHGEVSDPSELRKKHEQTSGHYPYLAEKAVLHVIQLLNFEGREVIDKVHYHYLKGRSSKLWLPFRLHKYVFNLQPDVIIVHGFVFAIQLLLLGYFSRAKIIVQHQGGKKLPPFYVPFFWLFRKYIDGYFFTASNLAERFIRQGVIPSFDTVFEVTEGSSNFRKTDKAIARAKLNLAGEPIFLWVGRLYPNKDPLTVLRAFAEFVLFEPEAKLYMIFQPGGMGNQVRSFINSNQEFADHIILEGFVPHDQLEDWYNAADYFISGSHFESCGFALCEAMACGCLPIVTDIPAFRKLTGETGILFEPGNPNDLLEKLRNLWQIDRKKLENCVADQFEKVVSFKAISQQIFDAVLKITSHKGR